MKTRYFIVVVFILLLSFLLIKYIFPGKLSPLNENTQDTLISKSQKSVIISGRQIIVEIADTPKLQTKGLSDRQSLDEGHGMLFIFPNEEKHFFWMKDMLFPIDIIWINNAKEIVYIDENTSIPETNTPDYNLPLFSSPKPVSYVLEVNAGFSEKNNIKIGDKVEINL